MTNGFDIKKIIGEELRPKDFGKTGAQMIAEIASIASKYKANHDLDIWPSSLGPYATTLALDFYDMGLSILSEDVDPGRSGYTFGLAQLHEKCQDLIFVPPPCRGYYLEIMRRIDTMNLRKPTFRDIVILAYAALQDPQERFSKEIIESIKTDCWLVSDTGMLYIHGKGVYIQDHPQNDERGEIIMDEADLVNKLNNKDPNVRFAKLNKKPGYNVELSPEQILKSSFIKALVND